MTDSGAKLEKHREYNRLYMAKRTAARKARRLCTICGGAAVPGRVMCPDCLVRNTAYTRKRRKRNIARGVCIRCEKQPSMAGRQACFDCFEKYRENNRLRAADILARRKAHGLCLSCGARPLPGRARCSDCLARVRASVVRLHEARRAKRVCRNCGKSASPGKRMCSTCTVRHNETCLKSYHKRKDAERVNRCG